MIDILHLIFSTNKLKGNIGASEFTFQAGIHWVINAISDQNKEVLFKNWREPQKLGTVLRENNPPLENSKGSTQIVVAASSIPFSCFAMDFYVLYDAANVMMSDIQTKLTPKANVHLFRRPYIVSDIDGSVQANAD